MTNPRTIDRRDVAHPTNPVGDHEAIEDARTSLAEPVARSGPPRKDIGPDRGHIDRKRVAGRVPSSVNE